MGDLGWEVEVVVVTRHDVELQLVAIAAEAHHDPESAANRERRMLRDVLAAIGEEATKAGELARAASRTFELRFSRWP
jgi:hypothetical protein